MHLKEENQVVLFGAVCIANVCCIIIFIIYFNEDGVPLYDGFPVIGITTNSIVLVFICDIVAGIGIIFAIVCFTFNVVFRKKRYVLYETFSSLCITHYRIVKLTSPNLNHIIILGSVLLYICVFFYSFPSKNKMIQSTFCNVSDIIGHGVMTTFHAMAIIVDTCVAVFFGL